MRPCRERRAVAACFGSVSGGSRYDRSCGRGCEPGAPDDPDFLAGGTIARLAKQGREVACVILTNGNRSITSEQLAPIREEEQRRAARVREVYCIQWEEPRLVITSPRPWNSGSRRSAAIPARSVTSRTSRLACEIALRFLGRRRAIPTEGFDQIAVPG